MPLSRRFSSSTTSRRFAERRQRARAAGRRIVEAATGREALDLAASGTRPTPSCSTSGSPISMASTYAGRSVIGPTCPSSCFPPVTRIRKRSGLLNAGADDYVTKPFSTTELAARVNAQIRRASAPGFDRRRSRSGRGSSRSTSRDELCCAMATVSDSLP